MNHYTLFEKQLPIGTPFPSKGFHPTIAVIDFKITVEDGLTKLSIIGNTGDIGDYGDQDHTQYEKYFNSYPENLYITEYEFKTLMDIWKTSNNQPVSKEIHDFIKFLTIPDCYLEIENQLDSKENFVAEIFSRDIAFTSRYMGKTCEKYTTNYPGKKFHYFEIECKSDTGKICKFLHFDEKSSLNRRDVLRGFKNHVDSNLNPPFDFSKVDANDIKSQMEIYNSIRGREALSEIGFPHGWRSKRELRLFLEERSLNNFAGMQVKDIEPKKISSSEENSEKSHWAEKPVKPFKQEDPDIPLSKEEGEQLIQFHNALRRFDPAMRRNTIDGLLREKMFI